MEIFLQTVPGLEAGLAREAEELALKAPRIVPGGVICEGEMKDVWRANLWLRGASRVLARIAEFRAMHLAQLDKRAHKVDWQAFLRVDQPVRVEAVCRKSKIYHQKAATERVERAIADAGLTVSPEAAIVVKLRIEDDLCTISLDTSGESLHKRGHKEFIGKAPMRETLAFAFLQQCGFDGTQTVVDPMCGSGTFVLEAADMAAGLAPSRSRSFAFENLAGFEAEDWAAMKSQATPKAPQARFYGFDRDDGAIRGARGNAERAGLSDWVSFERQAISDLTPPDGPPGLVMVNPPYGARIGNRKLLFGLYGALGATLKAQFKGWKVGLVTSDGGLAKATGLDWEPATPPVAFGGLNVTLWQSRIS